MLCSPVLSLNSILKTAHKQIRPFAATAGRVIYRNATNAPRRVLVCLTWSLPALKAQMDFRGLDPMHSLTKPQNSTTKRRKFTSHPFLLEVPAGNSCSVLPQGLQCILLHRNSCSLELIRDADHKATARLATLCL